MNVDDCILLYITVSKYKYICCTSSQIMHVKSTFWMGRCFTPVFGRHIIYAISEFCFDCHGQRAGMLPQTRCWSNMVNSPWLIVGNLWFTSHSGGLLSPCPIIQDYSSVSLYHQSLNHWKWGCKPENLRTFYSRAYPGCCQNQDLRNGWISESGLCRNSLITEPRFKASKPCYNDFSAEMSIYVYIYTCIYIYIPYPSISIKT